jgi:fatty acid desaturase
MTMKKITTKKLSIYLLIFIAGLIFSQYALQIWGIILWIASFSVGVLMHLKWNKWFIKREASVIPIGWIYTYSAFIIIMIVLLNIIPSMVSGNEVVQNYFRN